MIGLRHILPFMFVVIFSTPLARAAEPTGTSPGAQVLGRWLGTWDEGTTTMVWTWTVGPDANGKMMSRFVGRDSYEVTGIVKDRAGKVLMDFQAQHVRVKK